MDAKVIPLLAVGAVIMILLTATVLIPVINDAAASDVIQHNEGGYHMKKQSGTTVIAKDGAYYYINGVVMTTESVGGASTPYVITDKFILRGNVSAQTFYGWGIIGEGGAPVTMGASIPSITLANGSYTINYGQTTYTGTYSWAYIPSKTGDYLQYSSSDTGNVYVNADSQVIAFRDNVNYGVAKGTVSDLETVFYVASGNLDPTHTESITATEQSDGSEEIVCSQLSSGLKIIVPRNYTVAGDSDTSVVDTLLGILPVLVIAGILVGITATIAVRRE